MNKRDDFSHLEKLLMKINEHCIKCFFKNMDKKDSVIFEKLPSLLKIILNDLMKNEEIEKEEKSIKNELNDFLVNTGLSFKYIEDDEFENVHEAEMLNMKEKYLSNVLKKVYNCKNNLYKECIDNEDLFQTETAVDFLSIENIDINNPYEKLINISKANGVPMKVSFDEVFKLFNNVRSILDENMSLEKTKKSLEIAFIDYGLYF